MRKLKYYFGRRKYRKIAGWPSGCYILIGAYYTAGQLNQILHDMWQSAGPTSRKCTTYHYYRTSLLSRLGNFFLSRFPNQERQAGTKDRVWQPGQKAPTNRDKRGCQRHVSSAPFCPGCCYQPGQKVYFFLFLFSQIFFYFNYTFVFQLNLCI